VQATDTKSSDVHQAPDLLCVNVYGSNRDSTEFYCKLNDNAIEVGPGFQIS